MCVQMDLSNDLPDGITIIVGDTNYYQLLYYVKIPFRCSGYKSYGHLKIACPRKKSDGSKTAHFVYNRMPIPLSEYGRRSEPSTGQARNKRPTEEAILPSTSIERNTETSQVEGRLGKEGRLQSLINRFKTKSLKFGRK
nr:hypothetical protein Q903MT_gene1134 [Picea sitchensis]